MPNDLLSSGGQAEGRGQGSLRLSRDRSALLTGGVLRLGWTDRLRSRLAGAAFLAALSVDPGARCQMLSRPPGIAPSLWPERALVLKDWSQP